MIKLLSLEFKKCKRRGILLVLLFLFGIQMIYLLSDFKSDRGYEQGWLQLFYYLPVLNSILLPTVCAVLASRIIDMEHKGNTLKFLETIVPKRKIFYAKVLVGFVYLLIFCCIQLLSTIAIGIWLDFPQIPAAYVFIKYFVNTLLVCNILYLLQMILSLVFPNQAVSLSIGICGSMAGLFILFLPYSVLYEVIPWGLFGATAFVRMDWDRATRFISFAYDEYLENVENAVILWIVGLILAGRWAFNRVDTDGNSFIKFSSKYGKVNGNLKFSHLPSEFIKLRRSPLWIGLIILPLISALIGTFNYIGNIEILTDYWYSLWSQHTLFLCYFFMPALMGIYCGLLWRFEHMGTNFNQIMVNSSPWKIVASKLLVASVMGVFTMIWIVVLYVLCGRLAGIDKPIPSELLEWVLCGFVGCVAVCAVQLFLSLVIRNFAVPIGLALVGGIVGLFATAKGRWYLLPYSLFSVGMRANNPRLELNYVAFFVGCGVFACLFYLLGVVYLKRSDVVTQG
jgi:hypothetical protein